MGACSFGRHGYGKTVKEAYENAYNDASASTAEREAEENASPLEGYTGDLDAKEGYTLITPHDGITPREWYRMIEVFDPEKQATHLYNKLKKLHEIYEEKWGPALCLQMDETDYLFFGMAPE